MKILLLEDEPNDAELIAASLNRSGIAFDIIYVTDKEEFSDAIESGGFDVILSDNSLPHFSAVQALRLVKDRGINVPFILVTGTTSDEFAVDIMKQGASDYILKDRLNRLPSAILMAVNSHKVNEESRLHLEEVIKSESLMKEAERVANFGTWEVDRVKKTYFWSDQYYRILDYEIGEVPAYAASFYARVHPEDLSYVQQTLDIVMQRLENHGFDCRVVNRDGKIRHLYNRVHIERDEAFNPIRINGFSMDITETRLAEEQLKKTELSYKRLVDNIIDGLIIDDIEGNITYANDQFLKIFGYSKDDVANLNIVNYVAPEFRQALLARHVSRIKGERVPDVFEFVGLRSDGEKIWVEVRVSRVIENGRIVGTQSAVRDITKTKIAEQLREQTEANLRAIFDNTDTGFILLDDMYRIKSFNPFASRIVYEFLDRKLVTGKNLNNYFAGYKQELISDALGEAMNMQRVKYEVEFTTIEGIAKWHSFSYDPIVDLENKVIGVLVTLRDITGRKILELQGQKIKDDLIRRNNDLEQFAHIISHHLRAPVANMIGLVSLVDDGGLDRQDAADVVENLKKAAQNLDHIIRDINKILSINKDVLENKEVVNFYEITDAIVQILETNYDGAQFRVIVDFEEVSEIYSLKSYLHSIFLNLISNGIKYKKQEMIPVISIKSITEGSIVRISFIDNGVGIDVGRYEKRIFGLFNRFHTHVEGKGMGLFMVKTQAELLGGNVKIKSVVGVGTEFVVELPYEKKI